MIKLINLETGEVQEIDVYALRERGIPEGYRVADDITTDEWIELYCGLLNKK